jgi:hypothetical protein
MKASLTAGITAWTLFLAGRFELVPAGYPDLFVVLGLIFAFGSMSVLLIVRLLPHTQRANSKWLVGLALMNIGLSSRIVTASSFLYPWVQFLGVGLFLAGSFMWLALIDGGKMGRV